MQDLRPSFKAVYPEGCIGPGEGTFRGQCAVFAETVIKMQTPGGVIGYGLQDKINMVNNHGTPLVQMGGNFLIGDVVIQNLGPYGHVSVVNFFPGGGYLQLSESNFHEDMRVHHTRTLAANDPCIIGVLRGTLNVPFVNP